MQRAILHLLCLALMAVGILLIWKGHAWVGSAAMLCGGAVAGLRQTHEGDSLSGALIILGGFLLLLGGGCLLYLRYSLCGVAVSLLAAWPWCLSKRVSEEGIPWPRCCAFACLAFWVFGAALLFRGEAVTGGLLLAGGFVPWYIMERLAGRRVSVSLSLLGEVAAWCGAAAAIARERFGVAAIFIAVFLISRMVDDFLLVRKGALLSEDVFRPLSFRAYLNLDRDDAHRFRALGQGQ